MSAELRAKFTADASDFNSQVKRIDQRIKGVGELGKGLGIGKTGDAVGDLLGGFSMLGGFGVAGGIGIALTAGIASVRAFGARLDERTKEIEQGMPVGE